MNMYTAVLLTQPAGLYLLATAENKYFPQAE
jgi:hypothetical protein